jgi:hypothetical protein
MLPLGDKSRSKAAEMAGHEPGGIGEKQHQDASDCHLGPLMPV